jgi:KUP system potassium uptake protein
MAIVGERPVSQLLVYGGISCVFWTITFQTTFKYIYLTLKAGCNLLSVHTKVLQPQL